MRTLIITLEYPPTVGGIATHVYQVASALPADETWVLAPNTKGARQYDALNPWKTIRKTMLVSWMWPRWIPLLFSAWALVRQEKIKRILVHHVLPLGYVARVIAAFEKISYSIFFHGTDVNLAIKKPKRLHIAADKAKRLYVNSAFLARRISEAFPHTEPVVIHPCPGEQFYGPVNQGREAILKSELGLTGKRVLLTVGRLTDGKGFPQLARLVTRIIEKIPNFVWIIIGSGQKQDWLITYLEKLGISSAVRYLGEMPYESLPDYYRLANAFALLTHPDGDHIESWGSAFLEASASGLPVVAGRAGGVEEAVVDGQTGLVVDTYNDDAIVAAIVTLLTDKEKAQNLGAAGRARAEKEFRWTKQLEPLLNEV